MSGVHEKKRALESLRLANGRAPEETPLRELIWSEDTLRGELQRTLIQNHLNSLDLIKKFDKDGSGVLEKKVCTSFKHMRTLHTRALRIWVC